MAKVDADRAPNKAMNSSILGTQIANKNERKTKNERNRLRKIFRLFKVLKKLNDSFKYAHIVLLATENCKLYDMKIANE